MVQDIKDFNSRIGVRKDKQFGKLLMVVKEFEKSTAVPFL